MEFVAAGAAWALNNASPQKLLSKVGLTWLLSSNAVFRANLLPELSPDASIILPSEKGFSNATHRWREWHSPKVGAVVNVQTQKDVQRAIRYANENDMPFFARAGGHGATEALRIIENAVQIDMRGMTEVTISADGKTATIGGGARVTEVVRTLWDAGKQTVTGICDCVGISAPILGGGHGLLQGQYGLAADQVISAELVLTNGTAVTVSQSSNPDLFWAIKGAGHNFGIVTEWKYRIHDISNQLWDYELFIFSQDKLEQIYELTNKMMKDQPPEIVQWTYIISIPEIDPEHPIIWYALLYDGPSFKENGYSKPLHDIGPLNVQAGSVPMPDLAPLAFMGLDTPGCTPGFTGLRFPIGLKTYSIPTLRKVFDEISSTIKKVPELNGTFFLLEGYSTHAVKTIDAESTAFPHRYDELLITPYVMYKPDPQIDPIAIAFGKKLRDILLAGSEDPKHLRAYVNYAHGDESPEAMYGWENWRLEKLRGLKKEWDPENRLRWYNPFV